LANGVVVVVVELSMDVVALFIKRTKVYFED
jgi:hypothetical protein